MPINQPMLDLIAAGNFTEALDMLAPLNESTHERVINPAVAATLAGTEEKTDETILHKIASLDVVNEALDPAHSKYIAAKELLNYIIANTSINAQNKTDGATALSTSICTETSKIALLLLEHKEIDHTLVDKHKNTALHHAVDKANCDVTAALLNLDCTIYGKWDEGRGCIFKKNSAGLTPVAVSLAAYRRNPTALQISISTQLLLANRSKPAYEIILKKVKLDGDWVGKFLWMYAFDYCVMKDQAGNPCKIDLFLLDFIDKNIEKLGYNKELADKYVKTFGRKVQDLFARARGEQLVEQETRTLTLTTLNVHLLAYNELRTLPASKPTRPSVSTTRTSAAADVKDDESPSTPLRSFSVLSKKKKPKDDSATTDDVDSSPTPRPENP